MIELNIPRQMDDTKATGMVIQAPFTTDKAQEGFQIISAYSSLEASVHPTRVTTDKELHMFTFKPRTEHPQLRAELEKDQVVMTYGVREYLHKAQPRSLDNLKESDTHTAVLSYVKSR